jgi:hypothetical protein
LQVSTLYFLNNILVDLRRRGRRAAAANRAHEKQNPNCYEPEPGGGGIGRPLP